MYSAVNLVLIGAGGSVALLGDDDLGDAFVRAVAEVVLVPVDEHDRVRVLLDGTGLAQVAELRTLVLRRARLHAAVELGQRQHGHAHLFGKLLEPSRKLADFLLSAASVPSPLHQLQIVDHHQAELLRADACPRDCRGQSPPASRRILARRSRSVIAGVSSSHSGMRPKRAAASVSLFQSSRRMSPLRIRDTSTRASLASRRDASCSRGISSEKNATPHQVPPRHRRRRVVGIRDLLLARRCHIDGHVEHEGRLAHARTPGHDVQIARVQAGDLLVEPAEPGGCARNRSAALRGVRQDLKRTVDRVLDRHDGGAFRDPGDVEHRLLRGIDESLHVAVVAVALRGETLTGGDQLPDAPLLANDAGVMLHVGDRRRGIGELRQIWRAAHLRQPLPVPEPSCHADQVHRPARALEIQNALEDAAIGVRIEMLRGEDLLDAVEGVAGQQHRGKHGPFGVQILWRNSASDGFQLLGQTLVTLSLCEHPYQFPSYSRNVPVVGQTKSELCFPHLADRPSTSFPQGPKCTTPRELNALGVWLRQLSEWSVAVNEVSSA